MEAEGLVCERKFVSSASEAGGVADALRAFCVPDSTYPEGELESIYYDDSRLSSFREKANGDSLKRKIRIRWYRTGGPDDGRRTAFLEIKDRVGAARDKVRASFQAGAADLEGRPLSDGFYVSLLHDQAASAGFPVSHGLAPTVSIRYRRRRFVCPVTQSRVSIDYAIVCTRANPDIFPAGSFSPLATPLVVCEAKSRDARSWPFGDMLARMGFRLESFSKYGYFVERILQGGFS